MLKSQGVNIIIGLGHSGIARDLEIAAGCPEIDLIIGGHCKHFVAVKDERILNYFF